VHQGFEGRTDQSTRRAEGSRLPTILWFNEGLPCPPGVKFTFSLPLCGRGNRINGKRGSFAGEIGRWGMVCSRFSIVCRGAKVVFSEIDRKLLERCLARKPRGWEDFVDRFLALFYHVVDQAAALRDIPLSPADRDDICAEILLRLIENDFAILRRFRGQASLATYLAVVGRRIAAKRLRERVPQARPVAFDDRSQLTAEPEFLTDLGSRDEVEGLLKHLGETESRAMRLFYLEGKGYSEIARELGVAENSVGPILSRAREALKKHLKMREGSPEGIAG
jgi:RNA polymerase sigma-70 factor (ECF subfamily)